MPPQGINHDDSLHVMEYKLDATPDLLVQVNLGGWVTKSNTWQFVTSHHYSLKAHSTLPLAQFISQLATAVAETGRSDAQGRGPGLVLTPHQSDILETPQGPRGLLRLCLAQETLKVRSKSSNIPYSKIHLIQRDDGRTLAELDAVALLCFLDNDNTSPDSVKATSEGNCCCQIV